MNYLMKTDDYRILDTGMVLLPTSKSNLMIAVKPTADFDLQLIFKKDKEDSKRHLNRLNDDKNRLVTLECINFDESGTGTVEPVELAQNNKGDTIELLFWSYQPSDKIRKIEYTILIKEENQEKNE